MKGNMEEIEKVTPVEGNVVLRLVVYNAVNKFRSIRRAIRKGHVTSWGEVIPKRPFNNSKRTKGRKIQKEKERIYEQLQYRKEVSTK